MYKITLFDANCASCTSGVAEFYTEDINSFKEEWFKLESDEDRKERFLKSLNGEMVTDYYSDSPKLNIVQEDKDAKVMRSENMHFENEKFTLINGYDCPSDIYVREADFFIQYICFQGEYMVVGKYKLSGVARYDNLFINGYCRQKVYGNNVLKTHYSSYEAFDRGKPLYDINDLSNFKDDTIQSICYLPIRYFGTLEESAGHFVGRDDLIFLMQDIPGEAG